VQRNEAWNPIDLVEGKSLNGLDSRPKVTDVHRIEGTAKNQRP